MKTKHLYYIWAVMFVLCVVLGFVRDARGASGWGYTAVSLAFFLPPAALLYRARREGDSRTVRMLRCLSAASLGLSLLGLIVNVLSVRWGQAAGEILHSILTIVSTPMVASGYWALSLFLWAALFLAAGTRSK